jgi:hypothetical protein
VISFRYHLVSLVAAFLALAVGIVIGTTLADRAIVDGLRNRVDSVSANLDERVAANDRLRASNDRLSTFIDDGTDRFVAGELADQPVLVLVEDGAPDDVVDATVATLTDAGAQVRASVDLGADWSLSSPEIRTSLSTALGIERRDAATMRARLARLLVADLASPVAVPDDDSGPIDEAVALGLIDYEEISDLVLAPDEQIATVVITSAADTEVPLLADFVDALVSERSPMVVGEAFDATVAETAGTERGATLAPVLDDDALAATVATVDHLDLLEGRIALVYALADVVDGVVGHYGYGAGAEAVLPDSATQ